MPETPDVDGAYPRLSDAQINALATRGTRRATRRGEVLFREGDRRCDFFVILEGTVAIVSGHGDDEEVLEVHGPGRFLGDLSLLTGEAVFVTAVVREPGAVLVVGVDDLRRLVTDDTALGDVILRAYLVRRSILVGLGTGLRIVGSRFSPDSRRLREFATRNRIPYRWVDVEQDRGAETLLRRLGVPPDQTPVVLWRGEVLHNPTNAELAEAIGLTDAPMPAGLVDVVVVGGGPAGLAAALYGASEGLSTIVLDAVASGGQAGTSSRIENYLGFPSGISGAELAERALIQARKFGAHVHVPAAVVALHPVDGHYVVRLEEGSVISARAVVVATGVHYRRLPVPGLERFEGTNVFYAATEVEARACAGEPVAIVGGGNSAGQAALFLSARTGRVRLLVRGGDLARTMSRYLIDRIERDGRIEVMLHREVVAVHGDTALEAVDVEHTQTGERERVDARALFVFVGAEPHAQWLGQQVALDDGGFVVTGPDAIVDEPRRSRWPLERAPFPLETSLPGVFAAGDVRHRSIKRVAAAVGEGSMVIRLVHDHLDPDIGTAEGRPSPASRA
ncbi:MAG: thioredoxin reductase [Actinomycetota bacterium]|nr:thioredoxin reductase [Actinomycetota bacterium]